MLPMTATIPTTTVRMRMKEPATPRPLMTVPTTQRDMVTTVRRHTTTPTPELMRTALLKPATTRKERNIIPATLNNVPIIITTTGMVATAEAMATEGFTKNSDFDGGRMTLPPFSLRNSLYLIPGTAYAHWWRFLCR